MDSRNERYPFMGAPNLYWFNFLMEVTDRAHEASAVVLHTFDTLEPDVLEALSSMLPLVYPIGP